MLQTSRRFGENPMGAKTFKREHISKLCQARRNATRESQPDATISATTLSISDEFFENILFTFPDSITSYNITW